MSHRVTRSIAESIREGLTFDERWRRPDKGLICAWEVGRAIADREPDRAVRAKAGELPMSSYKGGVKNATKSGKKYGVLKYLAEWHGLRGEDLDIDLDAEVELVCSRTGMRVTYTPHREKFAPPGS